MKYFFLLCSTFLKVAFLIHKTTFTLKFWSHVVMLSCFRAFQKRKKKKGKTFLIKFSWKLRKKNLKKQLFAAAISSIYLPFLFVYRVTIKERLPKKVVVAKNWNFESDSFTTKIVPYIYRNNIFSGYFRSRSGLLVQ